MEGLMLDWLMRIDHTSCRVTVAVTQGWRSRFEDEMTSRNLPVRVIEIPFSLELKPWVRTVNMLRFLRSLEANVVVFFQGWFHEFVLGEIMAGFLVTRNHVFMHENLGPKEQFPRTSRRFLGIIPGLGLWWYIEKFCVRSRASFSRKILVVSLEIKKMIESFWDYPPSKVLVTYHGIDVSHFAPSLETKERMRLELGIPMDAKVILVTARLTDQKCVHRAIEAMDALAKEFPGLRLLIAGSGPREKALKELAEKCNCSKEIVFVGYVTNVADYLKMSDIYILPSDNEGLSLAFLEALASGLICVVTRCTGTTEVIEDGTNGFLVAKSTDGVTDGLRKALSLSSQDQKKIINNALLFVRTNFEINRNVASVLQIMGVPSINRKLVEKCL